jgi:cation diffusion facilitator CzcD-associated flavoprotein CzcO
LTSRLLKEGGPLALVAFGFKRLPIFSASAMSILHRLVQDVELASRTICIVGAGLSGIEAAKIMSEDGQRHVVLFEKSQAAGGIWRRSSNKESRVQVDAISYAPIDDECPVRPISAEDPFDNMGHLAGEVVDRLMQRVDKLNICFGTEVVSFSVPDKQSVLVTVKHEQQVTTLRVAQLHVRTGCLNQPMKPEFANAHLFNGVVAAGVANDLDVAKDFKGKRVVIVGLGAFAVENVKRALQGGAARWKRCLCVVVFFFKKKKKTNL